MKTGKVKFFDERKGWGWIAVNGGEDVYVHVSGLVSKAISLKEDDEVSLEIAATGRGPRAVQVRVERRVPAPLRLSNRVCPHHD